MFKANEYSEASASWLKAAADGFARELHPLLASVSTEVVADLPGPPSGDDDDPTLQSSLYRPMKVEHRWVASLDSALEWRVDELLAQVFELGEAMGSQLAKQMITFISETAEETGNVVDGSGKDFYDALLEAMEAMDFEFDEDGNHNNSLLVHPDTWQKLKEKSPTPEQTAAIDALLARKREEFLASRSRRRIS